VGLAAKAGQRPQLRTLGPVSLAEVERQMGADRMANDYKAKHERGHRKWNEKLAKWNK
jgi:hypothetical protein